MSACQMHVNISTIMVHPHGSSPLCGPDETSAQDSVGGHTLALIDSSFTLLLVLLHPFGTGSIVDNTE